MTFQGNNDILSTDKYKDGEISIFMTERIAVLGTAFFLDLIFGDPVWLYHPVRAIGLLIEYTEKALRKLFRIGGGREEDKARKYVAGAILVAIVLVVSAWSAWLLLRVAGKIHAGVRLTVECIMCSSMLAVKSLRVESMKVHAALADGDVERAREAVSMIVGRDTKELTEEGITKAAVETVAENTSDGVIAPLFYMILFGAVGGFVYKAINTMDSMVGYKNDRYIYFGAAAARLDDAANFIPSRLAALLMLVSAWLGGFDVKNAWYIYLRDRKKHTSPNSAQTEAVCAGALSVELAGDAYYFGRLCPKPTIGDRNREIEPEDIRRANRLLYLSSACMLVSGIAVLLIVTLLSGL